MALIEAIKYNGNSTEFVWKFPSEDLKLGAQLIVNHSQNAFFVKNGVICDEFNEGRYTLKSANIPILNKLVNIPFGSKSPFAAEVWYVNMVTKLDNKWGTIKPILLEDPQYGIVVPVRAFGQYGFKIIEPKNFLHTIVGTLKSFTSLQITEYFNGKLLSAISTILGKAIVQNKISLTQIAAFQDDLSEICKKSISDEFLKYGLEIVDFYFMSINIPENDTSLIKLKEAKELSMRINTVGKDVYQMDRSFDVMETAAENEGSAGSMINAGLGLGAGLSLGNSMGNQFNQAGNNLNTNPSTPPPIPNQKKFFFVVNGVHSQPFLLSDLPKLISEGMVKQETLAWTEGLQDWVKASEIEEIKKLFSQTPPPIPK
ncbi:SPFH domain-containing protein [Candidatus Woesearchaeota archaeon]|nr:SPFH domain-containing protein [Candidatus Woesearchaeota archaeon]